MIGLLIPGNPVPWAAHRGFGRKSFNPRFKEKEYFQWKIKEQYKEPKLECPILLYLLFGFPIPKSVSKKKKEKMIAQELKPAKRPDLTNCIKFAEDCLKGIVVKDDSQVVCLFSRKFYIEEPMTEIFIVPLPNLR